MSATQREHVIQVPDTPALQGEIAGGGVPDDEPSMSNLSIGWCGKAVLCFLAALIGAFLVTSITLDVLHGAPTAYSAAIAGAFAASSSRVSSPSPSPNAIPPVFNLTVHIKNPNRLSAYCVPSGTTAAVSYDGGATIGAAGSVPVFCAGKRGEREVAVPVWAVGAGADDVTLPLALQRREAVVDVMIQMPPRWVWDEDFGPHLVACSIRVGHGLSPCISSDYY